MTIEHAAFTNGTDLREFQAHVCSKCVHEGDYEKTGCAVMDVHVLHTTGHDEVLVMLIEISDKVAQFPECKMFYQKPPVDLTRDMFEDAEKEEGER